MPSIGFMCEKKGPVSFDSCLACAATWEQDCDFTYPMLKQMVDGMMRERHKVTMTNLSGCLRKEVLARILDYYVAPAEEFWRFRGTLTHEILAALKGGGDVAEVVDAGDHSVLTVKHEDYLIEERLHMVFVHEGVEYPVSGQVDLVVIPKRRLVDWKTAKAVPRYNSPYKNHTVQVNLYRRLCVENEIDIDTLEIVYMDMNQPKRTQAVVWPIKRVNKYLEDRLVPLWKALRTHTIPRKPTNRDDGLWMCENYCNSVISEECGRMVRAEVEADIVKQKCTQCQHRIKCQGKVASGEAQDEEQTSTGQ